MQFWRLKVSPATGGPSISKKGPYFRDRSLFITGGGGGAEENRIFRENFSGTSCNNFSTPTLEEYNRSIFKGKICANYTCLKVISKVLKI